MQFFYFMEIVHGAFFLSFCEAIRKCSWSNREQRKLFAYNFCVILVTSNKRSLSHVLHDWDIA